VVHCVTSPVGSIPVVSIESVGAGRAIVGGDWGATGGRLGGLGAEYCARRRIEPTGWCRCGRRSGWNRPLEVQVHAASEDRAAAAQAARWMARDGDVRRA
jgi:hypothetical protein